MLPSFTSIQCRFVLVFCADLSLASVYLITFLALLAHFLFRSRFFKFFLVFLFFSRYLSFFLYFWRSLFLSLFLGLSLSFSFFQRLSVFQSSFLSFSMSPLLSLFLLLLLFSPSFASFPLSLLVFSEDSNEAIRSPLTILAAMFSTLETCYKQNTIVIQYCAL